MDPRHLELAAEFCALVGAEHLLAYLALDEHASPDDAREALKKERRRLQGMQANPKWKDAARFFIKHYRALEEVLADPASVVAATRARQQTEKLPVLEIVIDGVLADGVLSVPELLYLREQAEQMGVPRERFEAILGERTSARGVAIPDPNSSAPPPSPGQLKGLRTAKPVLTSSTPEVPRAARPRGRGWWDDAFTLLLLDAVPEGTERLLDVACGLAWSAHTLLPERPGMLYVGVDRDPARVDTTVRSLRGTPYGDRVAVRHGAPEALPLPDASVDVVLSLMALQRATDTQRVFAEAVRVLRPGGRLLVAEPDGLGQQFYFDGHLTRFNAIFQRLCAKVDEVVGGDGSPLGRPGIALGPQIGARMAAVGLLPRAPRLHLVQTSQRETMEAFARRLRAHAEAMRHTGRLAPDAPILHEVEQAIQVLAAARGASTEGSAVHVLPAFLWVGIRG